MRARFVVIVFLVLALLTPFTALGQTTSDPLASADAQFRQAKFDDAVATYRKVLAGDSANLAAHRGLVRTLLEQDNVREAGKAVTAALAFAQHDAPLLALQGDLLFRQAEFEKARFAYFAALQEDKNLARAYWGVGRILETERRLKSAKQSFQKAYELDAHDPDIVLAWAGTRSKVAEQIPALEAYLALAPWTPKWLVEGVRSGIEVLKVLGDEKTFVAPESLPKVSVKMETLRPNPRHGEEGVGIKVSFNGEKPETLVLDTGASGILITRRLAEKAGVKRLAGGYLRGIGDAGMREIYYGKIDSVRVGDLELRNCIVEVIDSKYLPGRNGIIGPKVFSQFLVQMDYPRGVFELVPLAKRAGVNGEEDGWQFDRTIAPEMAEFTPFRMFDHMILLETRVNASTKKLFLVDSGSALNLVSARLAEEVTEKATDHTVGVRGLSGSVSDVYFARQVSLEFAGLRQACVNAICIDLKFGKSVGTEVSGILGHQILQYVVLTVDYRNGLLKMTYHP